MLQAILSWLGGPIVNAAISAYREKLAADGEQDKLIADLATRDLAVQQREIELRSQERIAIIGHWYEPANLLGYVLVIYIAKVVVLDSMLGLGETPAIKGAVGDWLGMIATFFVGSRGAMNVAAVLRRK